MTHVGGMNNPRVVPLLAAVALVLLPLPAHAQRIPTMALVLAALPLVAMILAAAVGIAMRSWPAGLLHAALVALWVAWFVLASNYVRSDLVIWASIGALVLHSLLMVGLIARRLLRRARPR